VFVADIDEFSNGVFGHQGERPAGELVNINVPAHRLEDIAEFSRPIGS
jgi:hypothetical protein